MRVKVLRRVFWVLNTVLVLGIVIYAVFFFVIWGPRTKVARPVSVILGNLPVAAGRVQQKDKLPADYYRFIHTLPIAGDPPIVVPDITTGNGEAKAVTPLARDYVYMHAKIDEEDPLNSCATLAKTSDPKSRLPVKTGEKVDGVWKLVLVEEDQATFESDVDGEVVVLPHKKEGGVELDTGDGGEPKELPDTIGPAPDVDPNAKPPREAPRREMVLRRKTDRDQIWEVPREEREWWSAYGEEEAQDVAVQPVKDPDTGKPAGLRVKSLGAKSRLKKAGLEPGDVVKSVNGHDVNSRQEAISFVKGEGKGASRYVVVVERKGRLITLTYNVKQK